MQVQGGGGGGEVVSSASQMMKDVMGPFQDIPGPEISAGSKVMSWFFDEYSKYKGFSPACVTGDCYRSDPSQFAACLLPEALTARLPCGW